MTKWIPDATAVLILTIILMPSKLRAQDTVICSSSLSPEEECLEIYIYDTRTNTRLMSDTTLYLDPGEPTVTIKARFGAVLPRNALHSYTDTFINSSQYADNCEDCPWTSWDPLTQDEFALGPGSHMFRAMQHGFSPGDQWFSDEDAITVGVVRKSIDISGPVCLEPAELGNFSANTVGLTAPVVYSWEYFEPCDLDMASTSEMQMMGPTCGEWTSYGGNQQQVSASSNADYFKLKVAAVDDESVEVNSLVQTVFISHSGPCEGMAVINSEGVQGSGSSARELDHAAKGVTRRIEKHGNHPNPFNPTTTIQFTLDSPAFTTLSIYDLTGREVAALVSRELDAGPHSVKWDATNLPTGTYLYRLTAGSLVESGRMTLVK